MSQNSPRQNYLAFQEWYNWAKVKYPTLKLKKKKNPFPPLYDFDDSGRNK